MAAWGTAGRIAPRFSMLDPDDSGPHIHSVWLWQLALAAVAAVVVVTVAVLEPIVLAIVPVAIGMAGIFLTTIGALIVPWDRFPERATIVLPYLDIVWVGFLTFSTELRLSHLWVFPITWLATQFSLPRLAGGLALVAVITLVEVLVTETSRASALRVLIALLALAFLGVMVNGTARQARAYRTLLRRQAKRSSATLAQVSVEKRRVSDTLDDVNIGIARIGPDGELLSANAAYRELYGVDAADPRNPAHSVEYDGLRGKALLSRERTFARAARGEALDEERVWLYDPDGRWHVLSVTARAQNPDGDEPASTILIARDITDMQQAERRRDALAAVVSHELRNPLTAVLGQADRLLERDDLDADMRRRLELIEESGERMMSLVATILTAAPERAQQAGREGRELTDLRAVLEASVDSFETLAEERDVSLTLEPGAPLEMWADGYRLRHVFDNLISNALKYTPAGGEVEVGALQEGDEVVVSVTDSGMGISQADLPYIFNDYFRGDAAVARGIPGTGLGMKIVREIIEAHDGTVDIVSEPGVGTVVTVRIPREAE